MFLILVFILFLFLVVISKKESFSQAIIDYYVSPFVIKKDKTYHSDKQINEDILTYIQEAPQFVGGGL